MLFVQEAPFNNMWLMVMLIWVQTGFAMVILSAAIKAVPTELIEAAKVDGATDVAGVLADHACRRSHRPIGVVVTALFVTVMKVFDIVNAMTNGNFGTQVHRQPDVDQRAFGIIRPRARLGPRRDAVRLGHSRHVAQHPPHAECTSVRRPR